MSAYFLRLKSNGHLLDDFKVPGAENFYCQISIRLEDMKTSPKRLGHAAVEQYSHKMHSACGLKEDECINDSLIVQPIHKDDAGSEEGSGDCEEVGCWYAVFHTAQHIM